MIRVKNADRDCTGREALRLSISKVSRISSLNRNLRFCFFSFPINSSLRIIICSLEVVNLAELESK